MQAAEASKRVPKRARSSRLEVLGELFPERALRGRPGRRQSEKGEKDDEIDLFW